MNLSTVDLWSPDVQTEDARSRGTPGGAVATRGCALVGMAAVRQSIAGRGACCGRRAAEVCPQVAKCAVRGPWGVLGARHADADPGLRLRDRRRL